MIGIEIEKILTDAVAEIQANLETEGINATGNTSKSIRVEKTDTGFAIVKGGQGTKTAPMSTLEIGRPAGRVPKGFWQILYQWSKDKGIEFSSDRKRQTFSYFLSKRIAEKGTLRHIEGGVNVYSAVLDGVVAKIQPRLNDIVKAEIVERITNNFK